MTAHAMNGDRERCLQAGMNAYVAKPVDHKHLLSLVEEYLAREASEHRAAERPESAAHILDADPALLNQMKRLFVQLAARPGEEVARGHAGRRVWSWCGWTRTSCGRRRAIIAAHEVERHARVVG